MTDWEKIVASPTILGSLKQDGESWPSGVQLFHLMGHYITVVCTVDVINGGLWSNSNNILGWVLLSEAGVSENGRARITAAGSSLKSMMWGMGGVFERGEDVLRGTLKGLNTVIKPEMV